MVDAPSAWGWSSLYGRWAAVSGVGAEVSAPVGSWRAEGLGAGRCGGGRVRMLRLGLLARGSGYLVAVERVFWVVHADTVVVT